MDTCKPNLWSINQLIKYVRTHMIVPLKTFHLAREPTHLQKEKVGRILLNCVSKD